MMKIFSFLLACLTLACIVSDVPTANAVDSPDVILAKEIKNQMDFNANPCRDFYQYSCGNWLKKNTIPDSKSSYGKFTELRDANLNILRKSVEDLRKGVVKPENEAIRKAISFYKSCLNKGKRQQTGKATLKKIIKKYGSWPITDKRFDAKKWKLQKVFPSLITNLGAGPLFSVRVDRDIENSQQYIVVVDQRSFTFGRSMYTNMDSPVFAKIRSAYRNYSKEVVELLGADQAGIDMMDQVYELERKLAEKAMTVEARRDTKAIFKKFTLSQFSRRINVPLWWVRTVINELLKPSGVRATANTKIACYAIDYIRDAMNIFRRQPKKLQAAYMMWPVVEFYSKSLLGDFETAKKALFKAVYGTSSLEEPWKQCLKAADKAYGYAIGSIFVKKRFSASSKATVKEITRNVRRVIIRNFEKVSWMDKRTKMFAKEKTRAIVENIGYPDFVLDNAALEEYYKDIDSSWRDYLGNYQKSESYTMKQMFKKYGTPVNNTEWVATPATVNAFYWPTANKITFLAGILQKPFYYENAPSALNYGSIGVVVGHEFSHGFDDQGREYDKEGNFNSWWTLKSERNFKTKADCFVEQYSKFSLYNKTLNGNQTLGENIADNGGIKQSFEAYRDHVAANGPDRRLPGLSLTSNQLFFVGFAQLWCTKYREQAAIKKIDQGVHSLAMFRVRGVVENSRYFASAFNCKANEPMNPRKKCEVW